MKLHHIGIVVPDLEQGKTTMRGLFPHLTWSRRFEDPLQQVAVHFAGEDNGLLYEIIAPTSETSPIQRALKSRRDVLNHLAYLSSDIAADGERLRSQGCMAIGEPKPGVVYDMAPIQFFLTPVGFLLELIEHDGPAIALHSELLTAASGETP